MLVWHILRLARHKVGWGPYLCRSHLNEFLRWMAFYEKDEREDRHIGRSVGAASREKMPECLLDDE